MTGISAMSNWTLFSNHGHVLICLSRDPQARLRDVAADVGITERAVQKIVRDLQDVGMISVTKNGRRNSYRIHQKSSLRHDIEAGCTLKDLFKVVNKTTVEKQVSKENQSIEKGTEATQPGSATIPANPFPSALAPKKQSSVKDDRRATKTSGKDEEKKDNARKKIERQQGTLF